jgi:hypothetical protein
MGILYHWFDHNNACFLARTIVQLSCIEYKISINLKECGRNDRQISSGFRAQAPSKCLFPNEWAYLSAMKSIRYFRLFFTAAVWHLCLKDFGTFLVSEAADKGVINHTNSLHEGVHGRWTRIPESSSH